MDEMWRVYYADIANEATKFVPTMKRAGVTVSSDTTLKEFIALLAGKKVVILIAHWRSDLLQTDDVCDEHNFVSAVSRSDNAILFPVRRMIVNREERVLSNGQLSIPLIIDEINRSLIKALRIIPEDRVLEENVYPASIESQLHTARASFAEELFPSIRNGAGVEFADGVKPLEEIVESFPSTFEGVLDLSICNCGLLAEMLRARTLNRDRWLAIWTERPVVIADRLVFYGYMLRLLKLGIPYLHAVQMLREQMIIATSSKRSA